MSVSRSQFASSFAVIETSPRHRYSWFSPDRLNQAPKLPTPRAVKLHPVNDKALGRHWFADFQISESIKQNLLADGRAKDNIAAIIFAAANHAQATILNQISDEATETGNVASVVIIQESHLSMHFIPEDNFISVDVFTCGKIRFDLAINYISQRLQAKPQAYFEVQRGIMQDDKFVAGIGVQTEEDIQMLKAARETSSVKAMGRHIILELYHSSFGALDNSPGIQAAFRKAIMVSGGQLKQNFKYDFEPQGVSAVSIAAGNCKKTGAHCHLTIHTYPEHGYAALDIFDATQQLNLDSMLGFLQQSLDSVEISAHEFLRGAYELDVKQQKIFIDNSTQVEVEQPVSKLRM